jgi:N-acetylglucosaminyldiphosphoundecaprenol N-acetyl-beta-D-mannosaminyltransferase
VADPGTLERRELFGLAFVDAADVGRVCDALLDGADGDADRLPVVVTPNVDHLVKLDKRLDAVAEDMAHRARWVLPDGQPVVWASRLLGRPLRGRLAGSDLVARLFPRLVEDGRTVVVVASSAEVARRVRAEAGDTHAIEAPHLSLDDTVGFDAFVDECVGMVEHVGADFVFVTLGFPKQCNVIAGILDRVPDTGRPLLLAVGASFDMHYGLVRRAPGWMQRCGLEWLYRFLREPRRLFRRYFVDDPAFVRLVWREWRRRGRSD